MLKHREPLSAFATYAMKRKTAEKPLNTKKSKKKNALPEKGAVLRNNTKLKTQRKAKQPLVQNDTQNKNNVSTNKIENSNKKNNATSKTVNLSAISNKSKAIQRPIRKKLGKNVIAISTANDAELKKPLRSSILTVNTGVAKMKQIRQNQQKSKNKKLGKTAIQDCRTTEESNDNPVKTSRSMLEWLIHPMKVEDFFA